MSASASCGQPLMEGGPLAQSPHAFTPVLSPGAPGPKQRRPEPDSTPQSRQHKQPEPAQQRSPANAVAALQSSPGWGLGSWTDQVFSADVALPPGMDLCAITGLQGGGTERVEVDTGTVITIEPNQGDCGLSVIICGDVEENVELARSSIEDMVRAGSAGTEVAVRSNGSGGGDGGDGGAPSLPPTALWMDTGGPPSVLSTSPVQRLLRAGQLGPTVADQAEASLSYALRGNGSKNNDEDDDEDDDESAALSRQLFELELKQLLQAEERSERLAQQLQMHEDRRESAMRHEEEAGARLAIQLYEKEKTEQQCVHVHSCTRCRQRYRDSDIVPAFLPLTRRPVRRLHQNSVLLSQAFFDKLPDGFTTCPQCGVPIETVAETRTAQGRNNVQLPKGAMLDMAAAERHKCGNRFRCLQCSAEFCAGCGVEPYHFGFDCDGYSEYLNSQQCRFCGDVAEIDGCCKSEQCRHYLTFAAKQLLPCGHQNYGVEGQQFPCLEEGCETKTGTVLACASDWCAICYVAQLREAPSVILPCGHALHAECMKERIRIGRPRARLSFNFLDCPMCNVRIDPAKTPYLADIVVPHLQLEAKVQRKAVQRWVETVPRSESVSEDKILGMAMKRFSYYPCFRCGNVFFGGEAECGESHEQREEFNAEDLVCGACSSEGTTVCPTHGTEFVEFKCRFCCAPRVATFFCGGTTHFCSECHKKGWGATAQPCNPRTCIFGGCHPAGAVNGKDEYSLGCGLCRNLKDR